MVFVQQEKKCETFRRLMCNGLVQIKKRGDTKIDQKEETMKRTIILVIVGLCLLGNGIAFGKGEVQLEVWSTDSRLEYRQALVKTAEEFEKINPDIKINVVQMSSADAYIKWPAACAAGNPPDITYIFYAYLGWLDELEKGGFLPVDDVVKDIGIEKFPAEALRFWKNKGRLIGIPYIRNPYYLFYRKDLFEAKGLKPPVTWEDVLNAAKVLNQPEKRFYGIALAGKRDFSSRQLFEVLQYTYGGHTLNKEDKVIFKSPETIEALKMYVELFKYTPPGAATWGYTEINRGFANGSTAMVISLPIVLAQALKADPELAGKIGVALPYKRVKGVTMQNVKGWSIFKATKHPKEAKMFLRFLYQSDSFLRWLHVGTLALMPVYQDKNAIDRFFKEDPSAKAFPDVLDFLLKNNRGYHTGIDGSGPNRFGGRVGSEGIIETMVGKVLIDKMPVPDAVAWADAEIRKIYGQ
jgi:multiple sugar transport system substrate-binding protein